MRTRHNLLSLALILSSLTAHAAFVGDDVLRLATTDYERADNKLAHKRIAALLRALKIPEDEAAVFPDIRTSKLIKSVKPITVTDCEDDLLIVQGSANISFANNCTVISGGKVHIAHASRTVVVSMDSIDISHDAGGPKDKSGVYVTKGELVMSHGRSPYIYAMNGADAGASGMTTYNTDVPKRTTLYPNATHNIIEPIFKGEPRREGIGTSERLDISEFIRYSGNRCKASISDNSMFLSILPQVRKHSSCEALAAASVVCEKGEDVTEKEFSEKWTIDACGKPVVIHYSSTRTLPRATSSPGSAGSPMAIGANTWIERPATPGRRRMSSKGELK